MYHHGAGVGLTGAPAPPKLVPPPQHPPPPPSQPQQKHDIFVGNLAFSTTEEQLHQAFSDVGRVVKVRMVNDLDTGKPRGFAFIEFEDPQAALSAIRNMNDYELNGRRIRVNFSNSSHLEALAGALGMIDPQNNNSNSNNNNSSSKGNMKGGGGGGSLSSNADGHNKVSQGTASVADALLSMPKGEMHKVLSQLKKVAETDPDEARRILSGHPQLPEAILYLMSRLDMIQTPLPDAAATVETAPPPSVPPPPMPQVVRPADPRLRDPRAPPQPQPQPPLQTQPPPPQQPQPQPQQQQQQQQQRPPPMMPHMMHPPPPNYPPPPPPVVSQPQQQQLDSELVQQVMSLTQAQIAQLPPDKQQSILALRLQITRSM